MVTPLNINEDLLQEALALDDQSTIDALVETALREYVQRRKRIKVLDLFGAIDYDEVFDYKQQRQQTEPATQTVLEVRPFNYRLNIERSVLDECRKA